MKIILCFVFCLAANISRATEPSADMTPKEVPSNRRAKTMLFSAVTARSRLGITKPKVSYLVRQPIDLWVSFDAPASSHKSSLYCGDIQLILPDGSMQAFPAEVWDGFGPDPTIQNKPHEESNIDWQLQKFVRKPGTYKVQWKFDGMETPIVVFNVVRLTTRSGR